MITYHLSSKNWPRKSEKYEFISIKQGRSEDLWCKFETVGRPWRTSDNSESVCSALIDLIVQSSNRPIVHSESKICLTHASLVPVQGVTVLLLHHVLYKGMFPMSLLLSALSLIRPPPLSLHD